MKTRVVLFILTFVLGGLFIGAYQPATIQDDKEKEKLIILAVMRLIESRHFQEKTIDNDFSKKVFDAYMKRPGWRKTFITLGDFDLMDDYEEELDDAIIEPDVEFFELSYELINKAVEKVRLMYPEILDKPFNFSIDEQIELDGEKKDYAKDDAELKQRWYEYLKYETLTRLADKMEQQETAEDPEGEKEKHYRARGRNPAKLYWT